jgi:radical SAM superfamily enzyme
MLRDYHEGRLQLLSLEKYVEITCNQLEMIPEELIIHRLTGDAPRDTLVGPMWSLKKWEALNAIDEELLRRNSYQGKFNVRKEVLHATNSLAF